MYIPKNRIKTNSYTRGNEYKKLSDGEEYIGYYWSMYDGTFYTGVNQDDSPSIQIIKIDTTENIEIQDSQNQEFQQYTANYDMEVTPGQYQNMKDIDVYNNINQVDISSTQITPQQFYSTPLETDYENGFYIRYFACKINEIKYLELDKNTYTKMKDKNPAYNFIPYRTFRIQWSLVGEPRNLYQANLSQVNILERNLGKQGFKDFLNNDFTKFYRPQAIKNDLMTDGTEYINRRTGAPYSGSFHIHPKKGPMVGAKHISTTHDYLDPLLPEVVFP